jgi:hypothetical protein
MRMKSVPAFTPLMFAVIVCERGVAALGPVAEKLRFVGETENCGGGGGPPPPPPPPPQAAMKLAMSVAQHASATVPIRDIFLSLP